MPTAVLSGWPCKRARAEVAPKSRLGRLALAAAFVANLLTTLPGRAAGKPLAGVPLVYASGRIGRQLRYQLIAALRRSGFSVVSRAQWLAAAEDLGMPRNRWFARRSWAALARKLRLQIVLVGGLRRRRGRYRLTVAAVDRAGERLVLQQLRLRRPELSASRTLRWLDGAVKVAARRAAARRSSPAKPASAAAGGGAVRLPAWSQGTAQTGGDQAVPPRANNKQSVGPPPQRPSEQDQWDEAQQGWEEPGAATTASAAPVLPHTDTPIGRLQLEARVSAEHFSYIKTLGDERAAGRNSVDFALEAKLHARHYGAVGRLLLRHDFSNPRRERTEAEEAYAHFSLGPLTISAGRILVSWGTANGANPTDVINQVDLRNPLDTERRGTWMLRMRLIKGPVLLEGYLLPVPETNLLPFPDRADEQGMRGPWRWLEALPGLPPGTPAIDLPSLIAPPTSLNNLQPGFRLRASFRGVDLAVGYLWRRDLMPVVRTALVDENAGLSGGLSVAFEFPRVHLVTFEAETTWGKLRLAAESLATLTQDLDANDPDVIDPYVTSVVGLDYRTGAFFSDHHLHFFCDLWFSRAIVGSLAPATDDAFLDANRLRVPLRHALIGRLRYEWGDDLRVDLDVVSAATRYDLLLNPNLRAILFDRLELAVGLLWPMGSGSNAFFGSLRGNRRVTFRLQARF